MQKLIASTIMVIILTGTIVVLLSSCSLLINQDFSTAPSNDFAGNVVFQKIRNNPVSAESHYAMGCHFQKRKKHDWAIEEFQAAVSNQPNYVEAYNRLGVSYDLIGAFDKALAAYEAALSVNPDLDYVHNNMGYSFMLQGKYDLAVASFQKAIDLKPEKSRYRNNLASAYIKSGQDSAAIAAFNATSDEAKAHLKVARVLYHDGEYEKAEAYYKKAARLNPEDRQVEKELTAAENLAKINAHTETDDKTVDETIAESHQGNRNRYGEDGFYTVPTEPLEELDNNDIVVVSISESNPVNAFDTEETTYFIGAVAPVKSSELTDEAKRGKLSIDPQQLLEENELRDFYGLDAANIAARRPETYENRSGQWQRRPTHGPSGGAFHSGSNANPDVPVQRGSFQLWPHQYLLYSRYFAGSPACGPKITRTSTNAGKDCHTRGECRYQHSHRSGPRTAP